jgi:CheY-like chemotaxis protein
MITGLKVAVVEDEAAIAMMIEMMLEDLGCVLAGSAASLADAERLVMGGGFDFALLDVNLSGHKTDRIAEMLAANGVPFAFASGYGRAGLPERFADRPVVQKPFATADLEKVLSAHAAAA